tara:strand:- start:3 stop:188 length:186 start_codon:yes stop_codon:yes gene_type:complete
MKFDCIINMDNDAFADDQHFELSRIIKKIASEVNEFAYSERTKTIWDINGNKIGTWEIKGE